MRIVYDIEAAPQVGGGAGAPYAVPAGKSGPSRGFRANLVICWTDPLTGQEEAIHIEGDAKHVREAMRQALNVVEISGQSLVDEGLLRPDWAGADVMDELMDARKDATAQEMIVATRAVLRDGAGRIVHDGAHDIVLQKTADGQVQAQRVRRTPFRARTGRMITTDDGTAVPAGTEVVAIEGLPLDAPVPKAYIVEIGSKSRWEGNTLVTSNEVGEIAAEDLVEWEPPTETAPDE